MTVQIRENTVLVGIDPHKYTHTAVFLNFLGNESEFIEFKTSQIHKLTEKIDYLSSKNKQVIVALEDTEFFGAHIVNQLNKLRNVSVRHVPPHLSAKIRGRKNKNDKSDASSVAKALLFDFQSTLPLKNKYTKYKDKLKVLKLALREREDLSRQVVRTINKAHALVHLFFGDDDKISGLERKLNNKGAQIRLKERLKRMRDSSQEARLALLKLEEMLLLKEKLKMLDEQITEIADTIDDIQKLKSKIYGCGTITASIIVSETQDVSRFKNESHFASYAIVAPKERSSASKKKMIRNKMGNKRLNKALHLIALVQIAKENTKGRVYYNKKVNLGKAKLSALRSLKRHIARKVYKTLRYS